MTDKRILIVIDMQKDFVDGALGSSEAVAIVPAVVEKIRTARAAGVPVLVTLDTHHADYMTTREGRFLPVEHCIEGTEGWQLKPEVEAVLGDVPRLKKPSFGSTELPEKVRELTGVAAPGAGLTIDLIGLCTDICVVSNALLLKAVYYEADMIVDAACCAGVTPAKHEAALETMRSCQIAVV